MDKMSYFKVTGLYRQEIHANVEAETAAEAVEKATAMFNDWLYNGMGEKPGIFFGPEEPYLDEEILLTEMRAPTPDDPSYWGPLREFEIRHKKDGTWEATEYVPDQGGTPRPKSTASEDQAEAGEQPQELGSDHPGQGDPGPRT